MQLSMGGSHFALMNRKRSWNPLPDEHETAWSSVYVFTYPLPCMCNVRLQIARDRNAPLFESECRLTENVRVICLVKFFNFDTSKMLVEIL